MNKSNKEQSLQELYNQTKANYQVPESVSLSALEHAKRRGSFAWRWINWRSSLALICLLVVVSHWQKPAQEAGVYTVVQSATSGDENVFLHHVEYQQSSTSSKKHTALKVSSDKHYQTYLASLAQLKDKQRLAGVIKQYDSTLVVQVCDLGVVQLSAQIVNMLGSDLGNSPLRAGQPITLLADNSGKVIGFELGDISQHCPS